MYEPYGWPLTSDNNNKGSKRVRVFIGDYSVVIWLNLPTTPNLPDTFGGVKFEGYCSNRPVICAEMLQRSCRLLWM